jgi:plastocyanin
MRRLILAASAAIALAAIAVLLTGSQLAQPAKAAVNLAVHVHDDYYHAAGAFASPGPGTNHTLAQTVCQVPNPPANCDAQIIDGDSITWVSPSPFATNPHSVTECTDNTFLVCGAGVSAQNPINDSGVLAPPLPGPSGWPYGPITFNQSGTYYYRCEIHPFTMRGRIVVAPDTAVGGTAEILLGGGLDGDSSSTWAIGAAAALVLLAGTGGVVATQRLRRRTGQD